jgi:hypothetical protein
MKGRREGRNEITHLGSISGVCCEFSKVLSENSTKSETITEALVKISDRNASSTGTFLCPTQKIFQEEKFVLVLVELVR